MPQDTMTSKQLTKALRYEEQDTLKKYAAMFNQTLARAAKRELARRKKLLGEI